METLKVKPRIMIILIKSIIVFAKRGMIHKALYYCIKYNVVFVMSGERGGG